MSRRHLRWLHLSSVLAIAASVLLPSLAPATVEEQRARLPPPASCLDPVEGVWMSHKYDPRYHDWYIFTLTIHRTVSDASALTGQIQAHSWDGGPRDPEPPPCRPGIDHWTLMMTARGRVTGARIQFGGTSWRPEQTFCGRHPRVGEYFLDQFSGTVNPELQEFQSVNNDGGRSINDPTVFRRVRCFDPPPVPHVFVAPPPLAPPRRSAGCGRP